ncbi:MAG TPA: hypothetical protein VGJ00_06015 [Rhabdochlamydiaceae bacterium]|jgi:hypothetical protein
MTSAFTKNFPLIATVFDAKGEHPQSLLHGSAIRSALLRLLPPDFFYGEKAEEDQLEFLEELRKMLPIFKWSAWEKPVGNISIFLLASHRYNAVKFFHEMMNRWLVPSGHFNVSSFFAEDFSFPEIASETFILSEVVISFESLAQRERALEYFPILESEIKLGLTSVYHANRILEIKGLSADVKTSLIQERIAYLLKRRPADFDYDIFSQMQHLLLLCREEFKMARSYAHLTRMIGVFYLFHKILREQSECHPQQRHVCVKLVKAHVHLPLGIKHVLSIFAGLNFLSDNEMFEERHLFKAVKTLVSGIGLLEESCFTRSFKEHNIHLLYLEIEKEEGEAFSLEEIKHLQAQLQNEVRDSVEKLKRPLFMQRNEEEVMRNIITLSQQLRYIKDMPQVIISFDEQTQTELSFTIILLRILRGSEASIQHCFEQRSTRLKYIPDRVKKVGVVRKKYPKEATVFRAIISAQSFIRPDHSIDLFKARQEVLHELQETIGEVRDYNGGMIAKQHEQFLALKALFPPMDKKEDLLLENVFHAIFPVEQRSVIDPQLVKSFFTLLLEYIDRKEEKYLNKKEGQALFWVFSYRNPALKQKIIDSVAEWQLPSSQLISVSLSVSESFYFGYIFCERDTEKQNKFLQRLQHAIDI